MSYATRKGAYKRGELSLGKFAQTYVYSKVWKLEFDNTEILTPLTFFSAHYRHELQVQSCVG